MSKTKLLFDVVNDIKSLGDSLQVLAELFSNADETEIVAEECKQSDDTAETKLKVTLEEVRAVLARKSQAGFTTQIQSIIRRFDAKKLSDVAPEHYEEILLLVEELSHE